MSDLTPMQAACWLSRQSPDGVAAHLYVELDGPALDPARLAQAVAALLCRHPRLRLRVTPEGRAEVTAPGPQHALAVVDLRALPPARAEAELAAHRHAESHSGPEIAAGVPARFTLLRLAEERQRLALNLDMIAADPASLPVILDDLAAAYDDPQILGAAPAAAPPHPAPDPAARAWWRARLADLPPPPDLPPPRAPLPGPASDRLATILPPEADAALARIARAGGVTLSTLMLALFQAALAAETGQSRTRLSLALFDRDRRRAGAVTEGANFTLLDARTGGADSLAALTRHSAAEVAAKISRAAVPGVELLRDLSRLSGRRESGPVVFTAGFDLPTRGLLTPRAAARFGRLVWAISQGPGVALDAQVTRLPEGMLVNWDIRLDLLDRDWAVQAQARFVAAARRLAAAPALWDAPLEDWLPPARPLTALQRAYLVGRGTALPLGGGAMQEARLLRGTGAPQALRARLEALVAATPALRCVVDDRAGVMRVADGGALPLTGTDLSALPADQAEARLAALWTEARAGSCDTSGLLWDLHLVRMPETPADRAPDAGGAARAEETGDRPEAAAGPQHLPGPLALIARFDGMILDGAGISRVMAALVGDADIAPSGLPDPAPDDPARAEADATWWRARLAGVEAPPRLPWDAPLASVRAPVWRRERLRLPPATLPALRRLAARHGLFPNSLVTAAVLEALARFTDDLALTVALPVAPPPAPDRLGTAASFLALRHDATEGTFADRARDVQRQTAEGLDHLAGAGVRLGRALAGRLGPVPLPVVVTNGLGWPAPAADGPLRDVDALTRTPQVALDVRLTRGADGALCVDLDHATPAVGAALAADIAAVIGRGLTALAGRETLALTGADLAPPPPAIVPAPPAPDWLGAIARNLWTAPPPGPALWHEGEAMRFAALGQRVRQALAGLAAQGMTEGRVLALCLPRGPDHVALTLAAALAGVVWLPLDAGAPPDRRARLIAAAAPDLVVVAAEDDALPPGTRQITAARLMKVCPLAAPLPDAATLARRSRSEGPCYRLFTSGTTGAPKAVVLSAQATGQVIGQTLAAWQVGAGDVMISVTPLHHDMSLFDLIGAAVAGVPLVLPAASEARDARAWNRLVAAHGVSLWVSVPAILHMLLDARGGRDLASLRLIAQGGDVIRPETLATLRALRPEARLVSLGGPTETTIWSIWHDIAPEDDAAVPYGRPLAGVGQRIVNALGEDCPPGVLGRIHTTGGAVALGYLRDGALDQTDFGTLPDGAGGTVRAYRTGDLGRMRRDGVLVFAGRVAGYVKVRGVRVSLGDVEAALTRLPGVAAALAVDLPGAGGDVELGALVVPAPGGPDTPAALRAAARAVLPESHVPTRFAVAATLPLSPNGKPDRAAARAALSPGAPTIAAVLAVCRAVLGAGDDLEAETPLLSHGLTPAHLRPLAAALAEATGRALPPARLARCATPAAICAALAAGDAG